MIPRTFSRNQIQVLINCLNKGKCLPKIIRRKIYYITKLELNVGDTILDTIEFVITREIGDCNINFNIFPENELSEKYYEKFCDNIPNENHWDTLTVNAYKRRINYLNHLIELCGHIR